MKRLLLIFILLSACSKNEKKIESESITNETTDKQLVHQIVSEKKEMKIRHDKYEIFLGIHNIEYFADRMVLKSKLSGYDFAKKTSFTNKDGSISYQVILGPFDNQKDAEVAEAAIKARTQDLTISKVRPVK